MVNRTDYQKYLKGMGRKRLDELAIFEIGGLGTWDGKGAPIIDSLPQRKAKKVIYRGIDARAYPYIFGVSPVNYGLYRNRSRQMLQEHVGKEEDIDALTIRWDGSDVPYPFSDSSFDEFHCHMVTDSLIRPEKSKYSPRPTPEGFANEVNRLLRPNGRVYLCTDRKGHFFPADIGGNYIENEQYAELVDRLVQKLRTQGFSMEVLDASRSLQENLQGNDYGIPMGEASFYPLRQFTYISHHVDFALIATKTPHAVSSK